MEKLNIAELLKNCPSGMELNCASYDNVSFDKISDDKKAVYPIFCYITDKEGNRSGISFTENGCESKRYGAKCVIFPKGKNTWEGFTPPCQFKDGDIIFAQYYDLRYVSIVKQIDKSSNIHVYCLYGFTDSVFAIDEILGSLTENFKIRFATEEEKQKLFQSIKDNGYKWNSKNKTLEKLIKPIFKVGDRIRPKNKKTITKTIGFIFSDSYALYDGRLIFFKDQEDYELVPNKFDINTLVPFESRVLVRSGDSLSEWKPAIFGIYRSKYNNFYVVGGTCWKYCIPYKGNEHLLGKTDDCSDYYKTWEK